MSAIEKSSGLAPQAPIQGPKVSQPPVPKSGGSFAEVLKAVGEEAKRGERLVEKASHPGGDLSAGDLLALQAGVYRWVETVDLASKLVDRATQAAKQVTQSNGG
ncbi:MAG: hypothetical protein ACXVEF_29865 [Polyangiales bacterium]